MNIFLKIINGFKTRFESNSYFATVTIDNNSDEIDNIGLPAVLINLGKGDTEETISDSVYMHSEDIVVRVRDKGTNDENLNELATLLLSQTLQTASLCSWLTFRTDIDSSITQIKYVEHERPIIDAKDNTVYIEITFRVYFYNNFDSYLGV